MEWSHTSVRVVTWLAIAVTGLAWRPLVQADDLDDAFAGLVAGRAYLKDFPVLKTRDHMVDDFIGANGETANRPGLIQAIIRAVAIRRQELPEVSNFPAGQVPRADEVKIRTTAVYTGTPIMTTLSGAKAAALGIAALKKSGYAVKTVQEYH